MVALAVLLTYVHDVGMHDPTPAGRRIHALYAAHVPFAGEMDDVLDRLVDDDGPVVRRIAAVDAVAPFGVAPDVVLRELVSLAARAQQVDRAGGPARRTPPACAR